MSLVWLSGESKNVIIREEFCDAPGDRIRAFSFNPHIELVIKYW